MEGDFFVIQFVPSVVGRETWSHHELHHDMHEKTHYLIVFFNKFKSPGYLP